MHVMVSSVGLLTLPLALCLLAATTSAAVLPPPGVPEALLLREGVVADPTTGVVYLMRPGGGTDAVELASGRALWHASAAAKPLRIAGDLLVALADRPAGAEKAALDVVFLSARDGLERGRVRVPLPDNVWSFIDDGPGQSIRVAAHLDQVDVVVSWVAEQQPMTGVAPGTLQEDGRAARKAVPGKLSGAVRIGLATGRMLPMAVDAMTVEKLTHAAVEPAPRLPNVSGEQYLSADGRHILVSERVADDNDFEKYRWSVHALANGARQGEIRSAFPQAPFVVSGTRLLFEARPFARRIGDTVTREPLKLRAVDLPTGAEVWSRPLRDTLFRGPFPETEYQPEQDVDAPTVEPRIVTEAFAGTWRPLGPAPKRSSGTPTNPPTNETNGAIHTLIPHPTNANILYVGTVNGGIWKSTNAAAARPSWVQLTDPQLSLSIGAMDLDPADASAQTLVASIGRFSSFGRRGGPRTGLLRTTNGGASWTPLNGGGVLIGKNISGLAVRGSRIVLAVNQADAPGIDSLGIFRSTDTGATFTRISGGAGTGLPLGITHDVARDPANPDRLFTGVFRANESGGQNGVYRSTNGGATWTKVSNPTMEALIVAGPPENREFNIEFALGANNVVYALIVNTSSGRGRLAGLFRSANAGTTWTSMDVPNTNPIGQGALHLSEAVDPTNGSIVYVAGDTAMFRCHAAAAPGSQCTNLKGSGTANNTSPHVDSREMAFDAAGNLLECDDGGISRRTSPRNNQGDWLSIGNDIQAFEEHSMAYDSNARVAMGGFQDNGVGRELVPDQIAWQTVNGGDGGDVAVDAISSPGVASRYSSSQNLGGFRREVYNASNVRQSQVSPALTVVGGGAAPMFQFVTPLRVNNVDGNRLLIGATNAVYESFDQGETIRQLLPAILVNGGGGHPLGYGAIGNANVLYVGSNDGVWVRTAAPPAALVQAATYPGTGTGRAVVDLAIDPTNGATAFVIDTTTVFVTHDAGGSWTDITGNLLSLTPGMLRSVALVQNASAEAVVVGTNNGVFAALAGTGFRSWGQLGSGFPRALVWDLDYVRSRDLLVAGTLGRGTWALALPSFSDDGFSATFDTGTDGFTFVPDAFGTRQPGYTSGTFVNPGGFSGGGLRVALGGIDNAVVLNMSGGWRRAFTLSSPGLVTLRFDFNLTQAADYEADETSDMVSQIDAQTAAVQSQVVGNGNGGAPRSTGPISRVIDLGCLAAGPHTVTLGARNNKKTLANESTTLLLDNVAVRSSGPCP